MARSLPAAVQRQRQGEGDSATNFGAELTRDLGAGARRRSPVTLRVAADIGGTFTDIVAAADDGRVWRRKVASTPDDFGRGTVDGILAAIADAGAAPGEVRVVVHATTVATNAILEG